MITIQHHETEKNGVFEAWMQATEEGACTEPVQVGEMTYVRPTPGYLWAHGDENTNEDKKIIAIKPDGTLP